MPGDPITILKVEEGKITRVEIPPDLLTVPELCRRIGAESLMQAFLPWHSRKWLDSCCNADWFAGKDAFVAEDMVTPVRGTVFLFGTDEDGNWRGLSEEEVSMIRIEGTHPDMDVPLLVIDEKEQ